MLGFFISQKKYIYIKKCEKRCNKHISKIVLATIKQKICKTKPTSNSEKKQTEILLILVHSYT